MNCHEGENIKDNIRKALQKSGAVAIGFAKAAPVEADVIDGYNRWIEKGNNAGMDYLKRHAALKADPSHVLENVATVISLAFSYSPYQRRDPSLPKIAFYAYGEDYHEVLRKRLKPIVELLKNEYGGEWRICIDSAPLPERYWAIKCGIGKRGKNGSVIVDNFGSYIFLAEILTTVTVAPDEPRGDMCIGCGDCIKACPQGALKSDGTIDSRKCINYLTIEHRGKWEKENMEAMQTEAAKNSLYGCDVCQEVCPHNRNIPATNIPEFRPKDELLSLTSEEAMKMTQEEFSKFFKGSPIKRAKLEGLARNAANITID